MRSSKFSNALLLVTVALSSPACEDASDCGPGTVDRNGRCEPIIGACTGTIAADGTCILPSCPAGQAWDPTTASCAVIPICAPGTVAEAGVCVPACGPTEHWDGTTCVEGPACEPGTVPDESGGCVPAAEACGPGTHYDDGECVPDATSCEEGTVLVDGECVPEPLDAPDVAESADGVADFTLPEPGEPLTLGGNVDAPEEGYPDWDAFGFEAPAGTWLRLDATSDGQALPAFYVMSEATDADGYPLYVRYALNPNGRDCGREIYLPHAGRYFIWVTDYTNAAADLFGILALPIGGDDYRYQVSVENLGVPAASDLGPFPATASGDAADGALRFYRLPGLALDEALDVTSAPVDGEENDLFRALMIFDPAGSLIRERASGATSGAPRAIFAATTAGDHLVVQDHLLAIGPRRDFELTVEALASANCGVVDCSSGAVAAGEHELLRWDLAANDLFVAGVSLPIGATGGLTVVFLDRGLAAVTPGTTASASATAKHWQFAAEATRVYALVLNQSTSNVPSYLVDARTTATPALTAGQLNTSLTVLGMPANTYAPSGLARLSVAPGQVVVTRGFVPTSGSWGTPTEEWLSAGLATVGPAFDLATITWPLGTVVPLVGWSPAGGTMLHRATDGSGGDVTGQSYDVAPYLIDPDDLGELQAGGTLEATAATLHADAGVALLRYDADETQAAVVTVTPANGATLQPDLWILVPGALESPGSSVWLPDAAGERLAGLERATATAAGDAVEITWSSPYEGPCFILVEHAAAGTPGDEFTVTVEQTP